MTTFFATELAAMVATGIIAILLCEGLTGTGRRDCEFNWELYEEHIIGLGNHDVYVGGGIIPEAMKIVRQGAIFDTRPLRELLERMVNNQMKFFSLGDLPIKTYISVVERDTGRVHRLCSQIHKDLPIVDVLMASTSIREEASLIHSDYQRLRVLAAHLCSHRGLPLLGQDDTHASRQFGAGGRDVFRTAGAEVQLEPEGCQSHFGNLFLLSELCSTGIEGVRAEKHEILLIRGVYSSRRVGSPALVLNGLGPVVA